MGIVSKLKQRVLSTMKSPDLEGPFELYITRFPGYLWAILFRTLRIHPIVITIISILLGAAAGWYMGQPTRQANLIGIGLLIWANWYDCADGQLARLTGQRTLIGRILDGFAGDVWFFSIYLFLCLRLSSENAPWGNHWGIWIWLLAAWSGLHCHVLQCNIADYYRNIHLHFLPESQISELDSTHNISKKMNQLSLISKDWFNKIYLFFYARYTQRQEKMTPKFQQFYATLQKCYPHANYPSDLCQRMRQGSLPLMPWCNVLTFDTRIGVLFLSLIIGYPWIYFIFEATLLEGLRYYVIRRHETLCDNLRKDIEP